MSTPTAKEVNSAPDAVLATDDKDTALFSLAYRIARAKFRKEAASRGFDIETTPIGARGPTGEPLTIDAATKRRSNRGARRSIVIFSGTHGVEGFFGSAAQLGLLRDPALL